MRICAVFWYRYSAAMRYWILCLSSFNSLRVAHEVLLWFLDWRCVILLGWARLLLIKNLLASVKHRLLHWEGRRGCVRPWNLVRCQVDCVGKFMVVLHEHTTHASRKCDDFQLCEACHFMFMRSSWWWGFCLLARSFIIRDSVIEALCLCVERKKCVIPFSTKRSFACLHK